VVDVSRGKIVYADSENAASRDRIAEASNKVAARILDHIESIHSDRAASTGKHHFMLSLDGGYALPLGPFSRIARGGYSITLTGAVNNIGVNNLYLGVRGGFNRLWGKGDVHYSLLVPFMAVIGYTFNLPKSFFISPALSAGGSWNYMKKYRSNSKGIIEPMINPEFSIGYKIIPAVSIFISAGYSAIFEKNAVIQIFSANVGITFSI